MSRIPPANVLDIITRHVSKKAPSAYPYNNISDMVAWAAVHPNMLASHKRVQKEYAAKRENKQRRELNEAAIPNHLETYISL